MSWDIIFTALAAAVGIILSLGAATAYFYKGRGKETTALWKEEVEALTVKCSRLEQDIKDANTKYLAEIKELIAKNATLTARVEALSELVSQAPQIKQLATVTAKQHKEVIDHIVKLTEAVINSSQGDKSARG